MPVTIRSLCTKEAIKHQGRIVEERALEVSERRLDGLVGCLACENRSGAKMVTPRDPAKRGSMIAVATTDEHAMVGALHEDGILTSPRDGNIRLSFHCYNTEEDIVTIVDGLERHSHLLAR